MVGIAFGIMLQKHGGVINALGIHIYKCCEFYSFLLVAALNMKRINKKKLFKALSFWDAHYFFKPRSERTLVGTTSFRFENASVPVVFENISYKSCSRCNKRFVYDSVVFGFVCYLCGRQNRNDASWNRGRWRKGWVEYR